MNSYKNKNLVISLTSTPGRLSRFSELNSHLDFEIFPAVVGKDLPKDDLIDNGIIDPGCTYSPGALGCALSHIVLWDRCVKEGVRYTIFEDDAIVHKNFYKYNELFSIDNEFIVWGWNFDAPMSIKLNYGLGNSVIISDQSAMAGGIAEYLNSEFNPAVYKLVASFGSMAYTITPEIARKLISLNLPLRQRECSVPILGRLLNVGIDVALSVDYENLGAVICYPPMVLSLNEKEKSTII